jgi:uncharacterized protein YyaL (SSP411 family)
MPPVDQHLLARENGFMIEALCSLYAVTDDPTVLQEAERSANWVLAHRSRPGGGFAHDERDSGGLYLGDTVAVGQALLTLYQATGDPQWLEQAGAAAHFIATHFSAQSGAGFVTSETAMDRAYPPHLDRDENAQVARFATLLAQYTGDNEARATATRAMRYLATPEIAKAGFSAPVLLAEAQFMRSPGTPTVGAEKK